MTLSSQKRPTQSNSHEKGKLVTEEALKDHQFAEPEQILSKVHAEMRSDINMPPSEYILRKNNNYERRKNQLAEPKHLEDIDLSLIKTSDEDNFVLFECNNEIRLIIFRTIKNIKPL